jgi:flagellar M-ring protein FliF
MKAALSKILDHFKKMDKKKRTRLIVLVSLILIVVIAVSVVLNQKNYSVLYSGMEQADAARVLTMLSDMGVDAKAQGTDTILVASSDVDTIRLQLASEGYPSSGLNYDIYQNAAGLGVTDSEKKVYYQYQLQENLRKTIMQMDKVKDAVVNIDLGQDSSYVLSESSKPATASIMLKLKDNNTLDSGEVKAIAELVSKSVSGLDIGNVKVVDSHMNLYTSGGGENETEAEVADSHMAMQNNTQNKLQQQVTNLLTPIFGKDNVLAQVNVVLDFDKKTSSTVEYSQPEGNPNGIAASMKELVEAITNKSASPGTSAALTPGSSASQYISSLNSDPNAAYYDVSREVNYQVNQTTTEVENAQGRIKDVTVSIVLNSTNVSDYSNEVKNLVSNAIGANTDKISVEMLPFSQVETSSAGSAANSASSPFDLQQKILDNVQSQQTVRTVVLILGGLAVMIILLSIIKAFRRKPELAAGEGFEYVADEEIVPEPVQKEGPVYSKDDINSGGKEDNLFVLKDYASENPESVANLLRNWLNEE